MVDDGEQARLMPLPRTAEAISDVATREVEQTLTQDALEVLVIVGFLGSPTRREIETGGEDCDGLVARMCQGGRFGPVGRDVVTVVSQARAWAWRATWPAAELPAARRNADAGRDAPAPRCP